MSIQPKPVDSHEVYYVGGDGRAVQEIHMLEPSDSDGLAVAERFYAAGNTNTRPRALPLHDVHVSLVIAGASDDVRATMQMLAAQLLDHDDVSELLYTVTAR